MMLADVLDLLYQSGPVCAGVLFGTGWCFWLDAVALSPEHTPALWWFPGVVTTLVRPTLGHRSVTHWKRR